MACSKGGSHLQKERLERLNPLRVRLDIYSLHETVQGYFSLRYQPLALLVNHTRNLGYGQRLLMATLRQGLQKTRGGVDTEDFRWKEVRGAMVTYDPPQNCLKDSLFVPCLRTAIQDLAELVELSQRPWSDL